MPADTVVAGPQMVVQVEHEPRLADARLAHDRDQARRPVADRALEQVVQQLPFADPADERRRVVLLPLGGVGAHGRRHERHEGVCLALHPCRRQRLVVHDVAGRPLGRFSDDHRALGCERLQPRGGVDDVAGDPFPDRGALAERDERLARLHRDAHRQVALANAFTDREGRSHRSLGVVLMGHRGAEDTHRGVADELVERAPEPLDLLLRDRVERHEDAADVLGVGLVAALGEPGEVGEDDRHEPPFLEGRARQGRRRRAVSRTSGRSEPAAAPRPRTTGSARRAGSRSWRRTVRRRRSTPRSSDRRSPRGESSGEPSNAGLRPS